MHLYRVVKYLPHVNQKVMSCLPFTFFPPSLPLLPANRSDWDIFVKNMTERWSKTLLEWLKPGHPVLLTRYEDVHTNALHEVKRMLEFLNFPYHHEDLEKKLSADFTTFKRSHSYSLDKRKLYSHSQVLRIKEALTTTATELKKRGFTLGVNDYL